MHSSRASTEQVNALIDFIQKNPVMQLGPGKGIEHRIESKRLWQEVTAIMNSMKGAKKPTRGWIKFWADKKCNVRKQASSKSRSTRLNSLDKRILDMVKRRRSSGSDKPVKQEDDSDFGEFDDDQSGENTNESKPIEFVDHLMETEDDRHNVLMDKLFQVMTEQAVALTKLAEASQSQAHSLSRLADSMSLQAGATEMLVESVQRIADVLRPYDPPRHVDHHAMMHPQ